MKSHAGFVAAIFLFVLVPALGQVTQPSPVPDLASLDADHLRAMVKDLRQENVKLRATLARLQPATRPRESFEKHVGPLPANVKEYFDAQPKAAEVEIAELEKQSAELDKQAKGADEQQATRLHHLAEANRIKIAKLKQTPALAQVQLKEIKPGRIGFMSELLVVKVLPGGAAIRYGNDLYFLQSGHFNERMEGQISATNAPVLVTEETMDYKDSDGRLRKLPVLARFDLRPFLP